jgi:glycosyltransferase involved in cell wall biosynthesis
MRAPVGGLFRHVLDLASEQAARGHAVGIVADSTTGDQMTTGRLAAISPKLELGVTLTPMERWPGLGDLGAAPAVIRLAHNLKVDVLHGHGAKGGAYARLASRALRSRGLRISSFYTPHGGSLNFQPGTPAALVFLAAEKVLRLMTDGLIFESDYARRVYADRVGMGNTPARVIPNGLQAEDFIVHVPAWDSADFLFIGELREIKGTDILLRVLERLNQTRPVTACIVGSGPEAARLEALAAELGLQTSVRFVAAMPAPAALPLGRCLVVPSRAESFPYVVLEAAAAGMPLIATDVGGIPEIVAGTDTRLIPAGDPAALANAMQGVLDDPNGAKLRAERLRAVVGAKFTVEAMTTAVLDFYATARAL